MNGLGEEEAARSYLWLFRVLTDFGEEQLAPSCCGTSRELAYGISVGYIEYQDLF